jgi:hypothetical protein
VSELREAPPEFTQPFDLMGSQVAVKVAREGNLLVFPWSPNVVSKVAQRCLSFEPNNRPTFQEIVTELQADLEQDRRRHLPSEHSEGGGEGGARSGKGGREPGQGRNEGREVSSLS